jgi:response regulator RpfG family c-di-GMP phosphodiesterase
MENKYPHTVMLVDDEASILKALKRLFRREGATILTADSGADALEMLKAQTSPVSLIISDQRMPGMNGATFLERSIALCPDAIRFLLTGYSDMDAVVDAVNKGKIHRYLSKPWDDQGLLALARDALSQVELRRENIRLTELTQRQNAELAELNKTLEAKVNERTWALKYQNKMLQSMNQGLEKSIMDTIRLLISLVESSNARLGHYMRETSQLARKMAAAAGLDETEQNRVEMAGLVHDIGLLGMPEHLLQKGERSMHADEFEAYSQHPEIGALTLSSVEGLSDIGEIVRTHHENVDGTGFPDRLTGEQIPIGGRILAVAADYCTILHLWPSAIKVVLLAARRYLAQDMLDAVEIGEDEAMKRDIAEKIILEGADLRYDPAMVKQFTTCIGSQFATSVVKHLDYTRLKEGMSLVDDLRLSDGRLLLTRGTPLNANSLASIATIGNRGLIQQLVAVSLPTAENDTNGKDQ